MTKQLTAEQIKRLQDLGKKQKILIDKDWLYQKYFVEFLTTEKIAKLVGCSGVTVSCRMKECGFVLRTISERKRGCLNPMFKKEGPYKGKQRPTKVVQYLKSKLPRGEKHFRYKKPENRIEPINNQIRNCQKNKDWKFSILKRDNFKCVLCDSKKHLEVDHIKSFSKIKKDYNIKTLEDALKCEELWDTNNGRTLCQMCHKQTETYGYKGIVQHD